MISHQQRSTVANFAADQFTGESQAGDGIVRLSKLLSPNQDVLHAKWLGGAVKPATPCEVCYRDVHVQKVLNSLSGQLDVAK